MRAMGTRPELQRSHTYRQDTLESLLDEAVKHAARASVWTTILRERQGFPVLVRG